MRLGLQPAVTEPTRVEDRRAIIALGARWRAAWDALPAGRYRAVVDPVIKQAAYDVVVIVRRAGFLYADELIDLMEGMVGTMESAFKGTIPETATVNNIEMWAKQIRYLMTGVPDMWRGQDQPTYVSAESAAQGDPQLAEELERVFGLRTDYWAWALGGVALLGLVWVALR